MGRGGWTAHGGTSGYVKNLTRRIAKLKIEKDSGQGGSFIKRKPRRAIDGVFLDEAKNRSTTARFARC